jgi:hypothetical protein
MHLMVTAISRIRGWINHRFHAAAQLPGQSAQGGFFLDAVHAGAKELIPVRSQYWARHAHDCAL